MNVFYLDLSVFTKNREREKRHKVKKRELKSDEREKVERRSKNVTKRK